jgi:hypothetical protein
MFDDLDPLASGRDADVFAIDDRRVLRRYRDGGEVANETAIMAHVAQFVFPVPAVYEAYGANIMMERLRGPTMLEACATGDLGLVQAASSWRNYIVDCTRFHRSPARRPMIGSCTLICIPRTSW